MTSTVPAACAGEVAVIFVAEFTMKLAAGVPPKDTAVAPVKFVPVMMTLVPPAVVPLFGLTDETAGRTAKVNLSAADVGETPPAVVTTTSTNPAAWGGDVAVICVIELTTKLAA